MSPAAREEALMIWTLPSYLGHSGDRDAPWENEVCRGTSHCHTAVDTPESLPSYLGRSGG